MKSDYAIGLSGQAISVYKLLLQGGVLSANEIGEALKITKHHIYRLTQHLLASGLIDRIDGHPVKYKAKQVNTARKNYLNQHGNWFSGLFSDQGLIDTDKPFNISFFQTRDEHIEYFTKQTINAKLSIKFIILALPVGVTSELMFEHMRAVKRGVEMKLLAIEHTKENHSILMSYKHMGAEVRHGKFLGWHLFLIDDDNTAITMFDHDNKIMQTGVNFVNNEINSELQGIFERYWSEAVPV